MSYKDQLISDNGWKRSCSLIRQTMERPKQSSLTKIHIWSTTDGTPIYQVTTCNNDHRADDLIFQCCMHGSLSWRTPKRMCWSYRLSQRTSNQTSNKAGRPLWRTPTSNNSKYNYYNKKTIKNCKTYHYNKKTRKYKY